MYPKECVGKTVEKKDNLGHFGFETHAELLSRGSWGLKALFNLHRRQRMIQWRTNLCPQRSRKCCKQPN